MDWLKVGEVVFGGAVGGTTAVLGLSRWLGDVWLGRLLEKEKAKYAEAIEKLRAAFAQELERYRAQLDRSIFVTRAHFETEYTAMKEVSKSLAEVKIVFRKLHPIEAGREPKGTERTQSIDALEKATAKFQEKLEEWAVFLEPTLYAEFDHCYANADAESRRLKRDDKEFDRTTNYFWLSYSQASQLVRDRIKSLAVMPRT
jgi:hypothetical protein